MQQKYDKTIHPKENIYIYIMNSVDRNATSGFKLLCEETKRGREGPKRGRKKKYNS